MALPSDRNQEATVWVGGLDDKVDESLLWELMLQAGPVVSVNIPRDKISREHSGYAFCEFASEEDADYAMKIMNMVRLYGKSLKINKASRDRKETGCGANIFVGELDRDVDDQLLYNTFSAFGQVLSAKVMYDEDGTSRGFGFVNFADFESSDQATLRMNGQFLCNREIHVSYAYKKEGASGEKHGSENERYLAKLQMKNIQRPHTHFASVGGASDTNAMGATMQQTGARIQQQVHVQAPRPMMQPMQHHLGAVQAPMVTKTLIPMQQTAMFGGMHPPPPPQMAMMHPGMAQGMAPPGMAHPGMAHPMHMPPPPPGVQANRPPQPMIHPSRQMNIMQPHMMGAHFQPMMARPPPPPQFANLPPHLRPQQFPPPPPQFGGPPPPPQQLQSYPPPPPQNFNRPPPPPTQVVPQPIVPQPIVSVPSAAPPSTQPPPPPPGAPGAPMDVDKKE